MKIKSKKGLESKKKNSSAAAAAGGQAGAAVARRAENKKSSQTLTPASADSGMIASSMLNTDSVSATSTTCPLRNGSASRALRARTVPNAACRPARLSPREQLGLTGGRPAPSCPSPPGKPLMARKPPSASQTDA